MAVSPLLHFLRNSIVPVNYCFIQELSELPIPFFLTWLLSLNPLDFFFHRTLFGLEFAYPYRKNFNLNRHFSFTFFVKIFNIHFIVTFVIIRGVEAFRAECLHAAFVQTEIAFVKVVQPTIQVLLHFNLSYRLLYWSVPDI